MGYHQILLVVLIIIALLKIYCKSDGKRFLTIDQHLAKLWAQIEWHLLFPDTVYLGSMID